MARKIFLTLMIFVVLRPFGVGAQLWTADSLGGGFEMRYVDEGRDFSGRVRCTLVRLFSRCESSLPSRKAVIYIHGYNDYFFQRELGEQFADHCYNFYALDLRRYGRSLMPGQRPFVVRNFKDYFADVDSAINVVKSAGNEEIVLMGHSTGGLLAAYYMATHPDAPIDALILNSPFLDWNLGRLECFVNVVSFFGRLFPNIKISTGGAGVYAESLERSKHGEWEYDTTRKSTNYGVDLGWVNAVNQAQHALRKLKGDIKTPILLMYSARSMNPDHWTPEASRADVVLDVADIKKYGMMLGPHVTAWRVNGGMHDLILSAPDVRYPLYKQIFLWLDKTISARGC